MEDVNNDLQLWSPSDRRFYFPQSSWENVGEKFEEVETMNINLGPQKNTGIFEKSF